VDTTNVRERTSLVGHLLGEALAGLLGPPGAIGGRSGAQLGTRPDHSCRDEGYTTGTQETGSC